MEPETVARLYLTDTLSNDELFTFVRTDREQVMLLLSLKEDGDIEVGLTPKDCQDLVAALQQAIEQVQNR